MIVSTKLLIPRVRNSLVSRPRLMRKLNEGMDAKLTLVSAQAGYGKTTVLSDWVRQNDIHAAWVSLDKHDNDWIQFWSYVIASIQQRAPGFGQNIEAVIANGPSGAFEPAMSAFLNELYHVTSELVIIFDDYHVIELSAIHQSLSYLLEHLPPHIHLYIASRIDLAIPTSRLLAKGEMQSIIMEDLRFQLDEGLAFFHDTTELLLNKEQVMELFHQTEGWISGLQLAAISLKRSNNIAQTIQQFSGQQHHISDYLLEEVFHHQSEEIQSFLLETSILNVMNASLCQAVTGQANGQEQLERLEQLNLFITALDAHRNWYRYHHLLSDFLQQMLFRRDPDKWIEVHTRAANWLEEHGFEERAVEHYLEAKQAKDAVRLIEKNLNTLVQSKSAVLIRWVSVLPENSFAEKPMIELFYISVLLGVGQWEEAFRRVEQAEQRFRDLQGVLSDVEWNQAMGNIYFFCSVTSYLQKDLRKTSAYLELVEHFVPDGSIFQTMGRNRYQGYELFDDHLVYINDVHAAELHLLKWVTIWEDKKEYPFSGCIFASYSKLLYEWNRLDEAEYYISVVLGRKDMEPFARTLIQIAISASRIEQAMGNAIRASEILSQLKLQINSPDQKLFMLRIEAEQACLALRQGLLQDAIDWLPRSGLTYTDDVTMNRLAEYVTFARVLIASHQLDDALHLLERLERLLIQNDCLRDRIKVVILLSITFHHFGQIESAYQQMESALHLAQPHGYIRSFIDEGPLVAEMLITCFNKKEHVNLLTNHSDGLLSYIKKLLQAFHINPLEELPSKAILTEQEKKVILLIAQGLSNKEIAQLLNITGETVKFHIKNLYRKLEVNNRVQALDQAKKLMILV